MDDFRVGCYIRVSTEEQAKEGFSIAAQQRILDAWCVIKGASAVEYYIDEGYSAKNMRRPAMQRLLADCRVGRLNAVLVWKLDRLSRSLRDIVVTVDDVFISRGIQLISATESIDTATPSGRLMLNILGSFAQNERENTSQRVRMVMHDLAKQANHMGGVPLYGYQIVDKKYVIDPHEAEAVRIAFRMKAAGEGYGAIIAALTAAGYLTRAGEPFGQTTLYDMFLNPRYKGLYVYNRSRSRGRSGSAAMRDLEIVQIENGCPAIVSESLWNDVNKLMRNNTALGGQLHAKTVYMLSGLISCGKCGAKMTIKNAGRDRRGGYYRVYKCPACGQAINYTEADTAVVRFIAGLAADPQLLDRVTDIVNRYATQEADSARAALQPLYARRDELLGKQNNIMAYIASVGASADPVFADQLRAIGSQLKHVGTRIDRLEHSAGPVDAGRLRSSIHSLVNIGDLDPHARREQLRRIVDHVLVYPEHIDVTLRAAPPDLPHPNPNGPGKGPRSAASPSRGSPPPESDIRDFFADSSSDPLPGSAPSDLTPQPITTTEQLLPLTQAMSHHIKSPVITESGRNGCYG